MRNTSYLGFGFSGVYSAERTIALAKSAEAIGLNSVWIAEDYFQGGAFSIASACAVNTSTIDIGIGVINPYTRHPALIAMEATPWTPSQTAVRLLPWAQATSGGSKCRPASPM